MQVSYVVEGTTCGHCAAAVEEEVSSVPSVASVTADLERKRIVVRGDAIDDAAVPAAIDEAGYEAA